MLRLLIVRRTTDTLLVVATGRKWTHLHRLWCHWPSMLPDWWQPAAAQPPRRLLEGLAAEIGQEQGRGLAYFSTGSLLPDWQSGVLDFGSIQVRASPHCWLGVSGVWFARAGIWMLWLFVGAGGCDH
jgi:hypothetical protein